MEVRACRGRPSRCKSGYRRTRRPSRPGETKWPVPFEVSIRVQRHPWRWGLCWAWAVRHEGGGRRGAARSDQCVVEQRGVASRRRTVSGSPSGREGTARTASDRLVSAEPATRPRGEQRRDDDEQDRDTAAELQRIVWTSGARRLFPGSSGLSRGRTGSRWSGEQAHRARQSMQTLIEAENSAVVGASGCAHGHGSDLEEEVRRRATIRAPPSSGGHRLRRGALGSGTRRASEGSDGSPLVSIAVLAHADRS